MAPPQDKDALSTLTSTSSPPAGPFPLWGRVGAQTRVRRLGPCGRQPAQKEGAVAALRVRATDDRAAEGGLQVPATARGPPRHQRVRPKAIFPLNVLK